ncbi:Alpha/Beta hydrolase protein [Fennellomyces sp. T-0311]|nr:Alpha/Beta hydrolase protein [Fennellomyces sp. T-0311]
MIPARLVRQTTFGTQYVHIPPQANKPTLCFIPGYRSDFITSSKSQLVYEIARRDGYGFIAYNHTPEAGSVQQWYESSCRLFKEQSITNPILVGASMGTWLSLLLAKQYAILAIIGIGGGVDFTEHWLKQIPIQHQNDPTFVWKRPSAYDPKGYYSIPVASLLDSRPALIMDNLPKLKCGITLIHGELDDDVTLNHARDLYTRLKSRGNRVELQVIKDGDHRLSRPQDLKVLETKIVALLGQLKP